MWARHCAFGIRRFPRRYPGNPRTVVSSIAENGDLNDGESMMNNLPLPIERRLTVVFRVEAGCLGPDGENHVEGFCDFTQRRMDAIDADFIIWRIIPRDDKSLPEMEYRVGEKRLNHDQAKRYLQVFGKRLEEFEGHLHDQVVVLIEEYLER